MLDNCNYTKIKLLHKLSQIAWYCEKHAQQDAEETGHPACQEMYEEIRQDCEKHMAKLKDAIAGVAQEGNL